jgi:plasmid stabilization system protein ParE
VIRVVVAEDAANDAERILDYLYNEAGSNIAEAYARRSQSVVDRLSQFPETGVVRPDLGKDARVAIIAPYLMIYDFEPSEDTVVLLRILHGRRDISERLLSR